MKILVCGGRDFNNKELFYSVLDKGAHIITEIIHGGASGAETLAGQCAREHNKIETEFMADWKKHGRAAGPIRNKKMMFEGKPDAVIAFPGGAGTADMISVAKQNNVKTLVIGEK